jgi:hypothetical protein
MASKSRIIVPGLKARRVRLPSALKQRKDLCRDLVVLDGGRGRQANLDGDGNGAAHLLFQQSENKMQEVAT